jgi:type IV secretory pathway TraG/TraD family ATPase VirD4
MGEDNAALLGAMFITKIQLAAMNRAHIAEEERRDFFLYVDEFQNFATSAFTKILAEARKYRLCLTLANQYIGQLYSAEMKDDLSKAIFGNAGTIISFIVGADDAKVLAREFGQTYTEEQLVSLGKYQIITKLCIDSLTSTPFYATTLPLPRCRNQNREKALRLSREKYTRPTDRS